MHARVRARARPLLTVAIASFLAVSATPAAFALRPQAPRPAERATPGVTLTSAASVDRAWPRRRVLADSSPFRALQWRSVGPSVMSARITDVAVAPDDAKTMYLAGATSGIWKTTNNGNTWTPIFDGQPDYAIGDLAIAPSAPQIIWAGTGEANFRQNVDGGNGVYRSTDGGKSWQHRGLAASRHVARIVVHPTNPDIVYIAALGPLRSRGGERGVYATTDGGVSWRAAKVWDDTTGAIDLAIDTSNPAVIFAASYARQSGPSFFHDKSAGNGVWRSRDGGVTWARLTVGLPVHAFVGRIGLTLCASRPRVLYVRMAADSLGADGRPLGGALVNREVVYRTDDGGDSWRRVAEWVQAKNPWYFGHIYCDPTRPDRVFSLGGGSGSFLVSEDGGGTWENRDAGTYGDHQALWIDPADPAHLVAGHDGGVSYSYDGGRAWRRDLEIPIGQIYTVNHDFQSPYNLYVGTQDSHSLYGPSNSAPNGRQWKFQLWGDGMTTQVDPIDPISYPSAVMGTIVRYNRETRDVVTVSPSRRGSPDFSPALRFSWNFSTLLSPHDRRRLYAGANRLLRSDDRGDSWRAISPDLTTGASSSYVQSPYATITTISESPRRAGLLAVGTDDGLVWVSEDDGLSWRNVSAGLPVRQWITRVVLSSHEERTMYLTATGKRFDEFAPAVYRSPDLGATWTAIHRDLPAEPTLTIAEDPRRRGLLYVGTERGVYASLDAGARWVSLVGNLPAVPVVDLRVHPRENELIAATYGRSVWILNVAPLQEAGPWMDREPVHLFPPRPYHVSADPHWAEKYVEYRDAIALTWMLGGDHRETVIAVVAESTGETMATLRGPGSRGLHQLTWDRTTGRAERALMYAPPGRYLLKLTAGDVKTMGVLEIRP